MKVRFDWDKNKRQGIVSSDNFDDIREHFSVENPAAKFSKYMRSFIPSRRYVITPTGRFNPGLHSLIASYAELMYSNSEVIYTEEFTKNVSPVLKSGMSIPDLKIPLRDYQRDIVASCLSSGRGTVILATAGGKTLTIATLIESLYISNKQIKGILIVPDRGLVEQTYNDFAEYGVSFTFSKWTGENQLNVGTNIVICNLGILQSTKSDIDWMSHVDVCIIDEVHKLRVGNKVNDLFKTIHTQNLYGFTGTMPEDLIDQWNIVGRIGPILYERNSYELRQDKYISDVKAVVLDVKYLTSPDYSSGSPIERYRAEIEFLINNKFRNNIISSLCKKFTKNALLLVDYISHGVILHEHLSQTCPDKKIFFIRGDVDVDDREKIKGIMEMSDNIVVVAISKIFSTGINIKNIHYIVFGSGGKAKVRTIQSIGRGLRLHKGKEQLILVDIGDSLKYGRQHLQKRLSFYEREHITYGIQTITEKPNP